MSCADHNATCDRCYVPGHCCRAFNLAGGSVANGKTMLEAIAVIASANTGDAVTMPFLPLAQRPSGARWFWCPNLGLDGRCTDYDNRPNTCRDFVAASDSLCIHHGAPEGVDMTAIASEAAPVEYVDRILPLGAALKATAWL